MDSKRSYYLKVQLYLTFAGAMIFPIILAIKLLSDAKIIIVSDLVLEIISFFFIIFIMGSLFYIGNFKLSHFDLIDIEKK